jgi:hypothetical protein
LIEPEGKDPVFGIVNEFEWHGIGRVTGWFVLIGSCSRQFPPRVGQVRTSPPTAFRPNSPRPHRRRGRSRTDRKTLPNGARLHAYWSTSATLYDALSIHHQTAERLENILAFNPFMKQVRRDRRERRYSVSTGDLGLSPRE